MSVPLVKNIFDILIRYVSCCVILNSYRLHGKLSLHIHVNTSTVKAIFSLVKETIDISVWINTQQFYSVRTV